MPRVAIRAILAAAVFLGASGCFSVERSWEGKDSPVRAGVSRLLKDKRQVSVALVGSANMTYSDEEIWLRGIDRERWTKNVLKEFLARAEGNLLESFGRYPNFRVVDRVTTDKIFGEMLLSTAGALSSDVRLQLGKLAGASHMIDTLVLGSPGRWGRIDVVTYRLIDIQTGDVLAAQTETYHR